jgi:Na+/H+ antiporter NhaD/arsenite permease-like protein
VGKMDERELFYRREKLIPRELKLIERKTKEKVFTDPLILTCLVIQTMMILIILILHYT